VFIVWGNKRKSIDLTATRTRRCEHCDQLRLFHAHVYYQYNHFWYAFGFVSGKQYTESCEACGHEAAVDAATMEAGIGRNPIPYWDRFGMLSALGAIAGMILFLVLLRLSGPEIRNIPDLTERMKRGDETALAQLRREAERGDLPSQEALADLLAGQGDQRFLDLEEAHRWTLAAARQGSVPAQVAVAWQLESGTGTDANPVEALGWYRLAASHGSARALNSVAAFYAQGIGIPADPDEAVRWFRKAAEAGDMPGALNLGMSYLEGYGVERGDAATNLAQAVHWLEVAANPPMTDATSIATASSANNELGKLYEQGIGVERDTLKALNHYQAASRNNAEAAASVERLKIRLAQKGA
jgi:TPR repeat protein